jgi:hypothetical protein
VRVALIALLMLPACGGDDAAVLPDAGYNCALDDRDEEFLAGMEKTGAMGTVFRLVSSTPAPPEINDNVWQVELEDDTGAALEGATVEVTSYMPDHNHISPAVAEVTEDPAGSDRLDPVNMFMPGVWEITIQATPEGGSQAMRDEATFVFCVGSATN